MSRKLKVAVNLHIVNKIEKGDKKSFNILTKGCENVEVTLPELAAIIDAGHAFCAQHQDSRKDENFTCSDIAAVDIDDGMTLADILQNQFVLDSGGLVYTTPSHTPEHHRARIVFELERTITDPAEMVAIYKGLIRKFGGDKACKDACRAFYGSKGSNPIMIGKVLSNAELYKLIELGRDAASVPDRVNTKGQKSYSIAARRSGIDISPSHPVTRANGITEAFELVPFEENIHCPVHLDRNPSAFVVKGKEGNKGVYCHSCAATFWMKSPKSTFDFYRADNIIRGIEYEQDPHNYYDEELAPAGLFDRAYAERSVHTFSKQFLEPDAIQICDGVTFISSRKGSGKSEALAKKVAEFKAMGYSILLVGHRQMLLQSMCSRLGLKCYFYIDDGSYKNNQPSPYYAICVDSMHKLLKPHRDKYDIIILDESEQIFGHLTGSTLRDRRRACYMQLFHYMAAAKSVIVADADLGSITVEGVYQAMGPDVGYQYYLNEYRDNERAQRDFHYYTSDTHLMQEMLNAIGQGGRYYIATNSITKADELQAAIRVVHGEAVKVMLVSSKTVGNDDVQAFIKDIKTEILTYAVTVATPTLGTGIDITFPNGEQRIDTVYGFFVTRVNTHFDIDQQLSRVRNSGAVKVWIAPDTFTFETEPEVIKREAEMNGELNDLLVGYQRDGSPALDQTYLNVYAHVTSIARASKNNLKENLLKLRARNGWNLVHVDTDQDGAKIGSVVKGVAKQEVEENRVDGICTAEQLSAEDYGILRENTSPLTQKEDAAMQRYDVENFYQTDISAELIAMDKKGAYRGQLSLLETYLSPTDKLAARDYRESELATIVTDRKKRTLKQLMLKALLTQAGLADAENPIKPEAVITSADLGEFAKFCSENSARLQDLFGMSVRQDIHNKPMTQLGIVLGRLGLSVECFKEQKVGKSKKIYFYRLDAGKWKNAVQYLRLRMQDDDSILKFLTV